MFGTKKKTKMKKRFFSRVRSAPIPGNVIIRHSHCEQLFRMYMRHAAEANQAGKQGCQMVYFQTKVPNLAIFWWALEWKRFVYIL
jgi:hypothetical protein